MNDWALITGPSAGIGRELAKVFAADHFNLVLVARNEARLNQVAVELRDRHGISTRVIVKDLAAASAPREIFEAVRDLPISILVNNAGFGAHGAFARADLAQSLDMMHVNMDALVQLTHLFLAPMLERKAGRILNVASMAAFQPGPLTNIYFATKAFVYSFSYALAEELRGTGVTVTALCPGTTRTEFFERAEMNSTARERVMMNADVVARAGYRALMKGKRVVVPGALNKILATAARHAPPSVSARFVRRVNES